jgi:hypothetical protein
VARSSLPRRAKGPVRPIFRDPVVDHLMEMVVALTSEISVARERLDTVERLLDRVGVVKRKDVEAFRPDEAIEAERFQERDQLIGRVFQVLRQQAEIAVEEGARGKPAKAPRRKSKAR